MCELSTMVADWTVASGARVTAISTTIVSAPFLPGSRYQQPAICDLTASSSLAVNCWPIGAEGASAGCGGAWWACGGVGGAGGVGVGGAWGAGGGGVSVGLTAGFGVSAGLGAEVRSATVASCTGTGSITISCEANRSGRPKISSSTI